jgi:hypothetical protein
MTGVEQAAGHPLTHIPETDKGYIQHSRHGAMFR